jgi:hypothetical protein
MEEEKNKVGRPLKFKTPEEMQVEIDKYFDSCFRPVRVFIKDTNKYINLTDENEEIIKEQYKPFTMSGLAYALGMSRQALLNYSERDEFVDTITRAKQKCEIYAEERLFDKDGNRGAVFSLSNNFKGWADKQTIETTKEPTININMINNEDLQKDFFDKEEE